MIRNLHLLLGLFCASFVLMYSVSAMQMAHTSWFSTQPVVTESVQKLAPRLEARAVGMELMNRGMAGEIAQIKPGEVVQFRIVRPGTVYEVSYTPATGDAKVKQNTAGFMGMLNRLHHINGFWHEYGRINWWSGALLITSLALIALGLSGIYLWFRIYKERLVGSLLLAASLGYALTFLFLMRSA